jgi:hypothetical protein
MAIDDIITFQISMPEAELMALAQLVKRIDYDTCNRFASVCYIYGARSEADVMWAAICLFQRELARAGFAPR